MEFSSVVSNYEGLDDAKYTLIHIDSLQNSSLKDELNEKSEDTQQNNEQESFSSSKYLFNHYYLIKQFSIT